MPNPPPIPDELRALILKHLKKHSQFYYNSKKMLEATLKSEVDKDIVHFLSTNEETIFCKMCDKLYDSLSDNWKFRKF
jgi:hypothetical protein